MSRGYSRAAMAALGRLQGAPPPPPAPALAQGAHSLECHAARVAWYDALHAVLGASDAESAARGTPGAASALAAKAATEAARDARHAEYVAAQGRCPAPHYGAIESNGDDRRSGIGEP